MMKFMLADLCLMYPHAIFSLKACYIFFKGICFQHNNGEHMNNEIIKFVNGDLELDVTVSPDKETVWLSANQMAILFDRDEKTIRKHINNTFKDQEVEKENNTQKMRVVGVKQSVPFYSLDVIISVGYRVKSQNGIIFRKWATSILKDYMIKGYAVNQKRLDVLNKTIAIQSRMLASTLNIEEKEVLSVVEAYADGSVRGFVSKYRRKSCKPSLLLNKRPSICRWL